MKVKSITHEGIVEIDVASDYQVDHGVTSDVLSQIDSHADAHGLQSYELRLRDPEGKIIEVLADTVAVRRLLAEGLRLRDQAVRA